MYRYTLTPNMKDWSFMEMYIHVRDDMNQVLAFNPNTYGKFEPVRNSQPDTQRMTDIFLLIAHFLYKLILTSTFLIIC